MQQFSTLELSQKSQFNRCNFNRRSFFPAGTGLWEIESGVVRVLSVDEDGTQTVLGLWRSGNVIGPLLSNVKSYDIQCLTNVIALALPQSYCCPYQTLLSQAQQTEELFRIVCSGKVEKRLQQFLLWLFKTFGRPAKQGWVLDLPLTHQDIAETIGTTRVTVTRLMSQFQQEGLIDWSKRTRILLDDFSYSPSSFLRPY